MNVTSAEVKFLVVICFDMKHYYLVFCTFFVLIYIPNAFSQDLTLSLAQNYTGKNFRTGIIYLERKINLEAGIKYHFNNPNELDSRGFLLYRYHAYTFKEHFGVFHNLKFNLWSHENNISKLYIFHNLDINYLGYKLKSYWPTNNVDSTGRELFLEAKVERPAIFSVENNLGIGFRSQMSERLNMFMEAGLGHFYSWDYNYLYTDPNTGRQTIIFSEPGYDLPGIHLRAGFIFKLKMN